MTFLKLPRFSALAAALLTITASANAAEPSGRLPAVVVMAQPSADLIGPYQQPRWSARGRFVGETEVYVLPTWTFFLDVDYQLTVPRHGAPTHLFTQELELGLPYRFQLAYENNLEVFGRRSQTTVQTIEARWAPANWGKIPLNPTLFAEYKFGVGHEHAEARGETEEEAASPGRKETREAGEAEEEGEAGHVEKRAPKASRSRIPDAFEVRLLLGEQFGRHTQWALNLFHEHELSGDRETETGFSQALSYSLMEETLRAGLEMQFIRRTERGERSHPEYEFDLGPTLSWKPTPRTRLDVAALFGATEDSPALKLFAVFAIDFGPQSSTENELEAPVSTRNR
jgi:hypothetical protein